MKILILGVGGIGCYYGAKLQRAGHQLTYVARGCHLQAMQKYGLTVKHESFNFNEPVVALSLRQLLADHYCAYFDLIVLCLKSIDSERFLSDIRYWLVQGSCPVLSLQNGVDNEAVIASVVGKPRTLGGLAIRIGVHIQQPGVVYAQGVAQVIFGAWPNAIESSINTALVEQWRMLFIKAGIDVQQSDDIQQELWRKLLINNGVNPLSAVTGLDTRSLTANPILGRTIYTLMEETAMAAQCDGVELSKADIDDMFTLISNFDPIKTSMLVDLEKGRELELDAISGAVLQRCQLHQLKAPMTELVDALLRVKVLQRNCVVSV
ncbi:ketopantoate reductase family protein [Dasania marina]|uniref:ketopantoate reductase family protein n=1 Tax=Dasania marina TaxID=471499 RepID=UPI00037ECF83|nr:2-dehydropantoate 2-reductase [Dasania marina]